MDENLQYKGEAEMTVSEVKVKTGSLLSQGKVVLLYKDATEPDVVKKLKSVSIGRVVKMLVTSGQVVKPGESVLQFSGGCQHPTIMKDMCAECGADLRKMDNTKNIGANVAMIHAIPELKVSDIEAKNIGHEDQTRLLNNRKLVLLVDLDQTIIHTTNDDIPPNLKDVYHFQLYGERSPWYHTRIRPKTQEFLQKISSLYELHICTFGARLYAHTIAAFLDPDKKYFSHRILSRDECFDARSKTANMSALFPCGDSMVCIIDDREDVWNFAPNLVHVKPYHFFKHTGDINAPPGLAKKENDDKVGLNFNKLKEKKPLNFEGKINKLKKSEENESSSSESDAEGNDKEKSKPMEEQKRERKDSIDMPLMDSEKNEKENEKPDEEMKEKQPKEDQENNQVNDDLEISDSDDSNSKSKVTPKDIKATEEKTENKVEVDDPDDYLLYLEDILKTLHKAFYDLHDQYKLDSKVPAPDLKTVIPYVKRKVLAGAVIVFSGVIPTQVPVERSKPFLLARSLGASVKNHVDGDTTHLVAARLGTAKVSINLVNCSVKCKYNVYLQVNDARKYGCVHIVTPDWLWSCSERWERVCEDLFTLTKTSAVTRRPPAHCSSPEIAFAQRWDL